VKLSVKYFSDTLVRTLAASTSITIFVKMLKFSEDFFFFFSKQQNFCEGKIENLLEYFRIFNSFDMGFSKLIKLFQTCVGDVPVLLKNRILKSHNLPLSSKTQSRI
jgi:hypothetical protein